MGKILLLLVIANLTAISQTWQWATIFSHKNQAEEMAYLLKTGRSGNIYVNGTSIYSSAGPGATYIQYNVAFAYTPAGAQTFSAPLANGYWSTALDDAGNTYMCSSNLINKYNNTGQLVWAKTVNNRKYSQLVPAGNGKLFLGGYTIGSYYCSDTSICSMLDSNGVELWSRKGDYVKNCGPEAPLAADKFGNVYCIVMVNINSVWTTKLAIYSAVGNLINDFTLTPFNTGGTWGEYKLDVADDQNIYIVGGYYANYPKIKLKLLKYNSAGTLLLNNDINIKYGNLHCLTHDKNNDVYVAGDFKDSCTYQNTTILGGQSNIIMKISKTGNFIWESHTTPVMPGGFSYRALAVDSLGDIYVGGSVSDTQQIGSYTLTAEHSYGDMLIAKFTPPAIVTDIQVKDFIVTQGSQIYPNPSNGYLNVLCQSAKYSICVFNNLGQLVFGEKEIAGNNNKQFNLTYLNKGVYIMEVKTVNSIERKKIVIE